MSENSIPVFKESQESFLNLVIKIIVVQNINRISENSIPGKPENPGKPEEPGKLSEPSY